MTRTTVTILFLMAAAVVIYLLWERSITHPATQATNDANSTDLGASVTLGGNLTQARYGANTPWLYPPPLAFMMPVATASDRASVTG